MKIHKKKKLLITSGCSFSETSNQMQSWPIQLNRHFQNFGLISKGMSSQGNGLIARSIIYEVSKALEDTLPQNIIVGIGWSGADRHEVWVDNPTCQQYNNTDGWIQNPTGFIDGTKSWEIFNHHWTTTKSKIFYKNFYTEVGKLIDTIENVLRVQWFLEKHNIKYFMTRMCDWQDSLAEHHAEIGYLVKLIDKTKFLPVMGMYEWARDESGLPLGPDDYHPTVAQHIMFTQEIILPFLKKTYDLS
ncbi:MAG: hypothetical protein CMG35_12170 [Candidatus Marinimicrobia bacterium]|jgi:hypothetical protein|nr:hypothetical protein [Candidatus Neomarinimicrobiota bacterium]MBO03388.1 hypothetical protein [Candidatus Neomarinimicrobiota bacterium]|tara:strand:- start:1751 stop:2485 length:735 start_codon:yes stop_codon:yes gene_type:complete